MSIGLAIVGAGYWGANLVRTALATPAFRLDWLCDLQVERARAILGPYTTVRLTDSYEEILSDPDTAPVAIATPTAPRPGTRHPARTTLRVRRGAPGPRKSGPGGQPAPRLGRRGRKSALACPPLGLGAHVRPHVLLHPGCSAHPRAHPRR